MRVIVNRTLCDGNGDCVREAPDLFALDDDGFAALLTQPADPAARDRARLAARACPKAAITIED